MFYVLFLVMVTELYIIAKADQTVHSKWVNFITQKLCLKKVERNVFCVWTRDSSMFPGSNLLGDPVIVRGQSVPSRHPCFCEHLCFSFLASKTRVLRCLAECEEENINRQKALWKHRRSSLINKWLHSSVSPRPRIQSPDYTSLERTGATASSPSPPTGKSYNFNDNYELYFTKLICA